MNLALLYWLQAHPGAAAILVGAFGLLIGSFLNVVILRLPKRLQWSWHREARQYLAEEAMEGGEDALPGAQAPDPGVGETAPPDIVFPESRCASCGHKIRAWENIPVISFFFLRGKCASCKTKLSWQYPAVELLTGVLFAVASLVLGLGWPLVFTLVAIALLVAMAGIDFHTQLLPDQLTFPFLWLGLIGAAIGIAGLPSATGAIFGAMAGYLSLWSIFWLFKIVTGKEGMGYGDFKLMAGLGAWCGAKALIPIALVACVLGVAIGVFMIAVRGRDKRAPFAFGPYLALAGLVELLAGGWLWRMLGVPA